MTNWTWSPVGRALVLALVFAGVRPVLASPTGGASGAEPLRRAGAALPLGDGRAPSETTRALAARVLGAGDHRGRSFAIVDKPAARITVYRADGTVAASSPVLLGRVPGDHTVPGVGERTQAGRLRPGDATTPAGRFVATPGRNLDGEAVLWVDPEAAFAIHRLRDDAAQRDRARRLASPHVPVRRTTAGCVVVPVAFFEGVVQPLFGRRGGVVYVTPEERPWQALWEAIAEGTL